MGNRIEGWGLSQSIYYGLKHPEQFENFAHLISMGRSMSPLSLTRVFPQYQNFAQMENPLLWINEQLINPQLSQYTQFVALIGPSASGKDSILEQMYLEMGENKVSTILTATDRDVRSIGADRNYIFLTKQRMADYISSEGMIETLRQGQHTYGTPAQSVEDAIAQQRKVAIWRGDLSGLPTMQAWMNKKHPETPFFSVFVIPGIRPLKYFNNLINKRGVVDSLRWRIPKALWELENAPSLTQIALVNPFEEGGLPVATTALCDFLQSLRG